MRSPIIQSPFEVWSVGYEKNTGLEISSEGNMKVEIHEYELNQMESRFLTRMIR